MLRHFKGVTDMAKSKELKDYEKALTEKYGVDFKNKWNSTEFRKYLKLKKIKLSYRKKPEYSLTKNVAVSYRASGIHKSKK